MDRKQLNEYLGTGLFHDETDEISIRLDQPSIGRIALSGVESVFDGFDWEAGHVIITPSEPLVSWKYLEKYHPGIREMIEQDRKRYNTRSRRVIVAGSRGFTDTPEHRKMMETAMKGLVIPQYVSADKIEVISGCARGADSLGAEIARELGYAVKEFPANWEKYGKAAGAIRNKEMADYASEDDFQWMGILLAFWDKESRGTANMIEEAKKRGMQVRVFPYD